MSPQPELVVLVDEHGHSIGETEKSSVHTNNTALHLAFSCHVFNRNGEVLVTRRALSKATWPGVWTNSFCGHPAPGERFEDAIARRAERELGIVVTEIRSLLPDFRYRAVDASGVVENEICPVFTALSDSEPKAAPDEIAEYAWVNPAEVAVAVKSTPFAFSPWFGWQLAELASSNIAYGPVDGEARST